MSGSTITERWINNDDLFEHLHDRHPPGPALPFNASNSSLQPTEYGTDGPVSHTLPLRSQGYASPAPSFGSRRLRRQYGSNIRSASASPTPNRGQITRGDSLHASFSSLRPRHYYQDSTGTMDTMSTMSTTASVTSMHSHSSMGMRSASASPRPWRNRPDLVVSVRASRPPSELFLPSPGHMQRQESFRTAVSGDSDHKTSLANVVSNIDVGLKIVHKSSRRSSPAPSVKSNKSIVLQGLQRTGSTLSLVRTLSQKGNALPRKASARAKGSSARGAGARPVSVLVKKRRGSKFSGIDKNLTATRRTSVMMEKRRSGLLSPTSPMSPTSPTMKRKSQRGVQMPWRRRRRGETMSMLVDAGFFPIQELIYASEEREGENHVRARNTKRFTMTSLPPTPTSIVGTPTELYHQSSPRTPRRVIRNKALTGAGKRSSLSQMSFSSDSLTPTSDKSPNSLDDIAEDEGSQASQGDVAETAAESTIVQPVTTEIHLATGTVLTVSPPEATAWKRSAYIQGPIKLAKPAVIPRKNSIASLQPFQEAVEQVYQDALTSPRAKTDEAVCDEICEWADGYGFGDIKFDGDRFEFSETDVMDVKSSDRPFNVILARLSTVEEDSTVADVAEGLPALAAPHHQAREESLSVLPHSPVIKFQGEQVIQTATASPEPDEQERRLSVELEVEETSARPLWIIYNSSSKGSSPRSLHGVQRPPPKKLSSVKKMRKFMQTASAIL